MLKIHDRGSAVLIEVEFKKRTPFIGEALFDPSTSSITVTDPASVSKVTAASLTKSATGQWFYVCQTAENWISGVYIVTIFAIDGSNSDVTVISQAFRLK